MSDVKDIEDAVAALAATDFARFREWFDALAAERFDDAIANDVSLGRLEQLAEQALSDAREGRVRDL